ncbi:MAG TPA: type II secretion system F family protein [Isosphaeraceae bacterium]|jgi:tight adherence protein B|nr:type II secretion system F family protein [Isosphaeraceae bacterium]
MGTTLIPVLIGVAVIVLVGALGLVMAQSGGSAAEQRLDEISGRRKASKADPAQGMLLRPPALDLGGAKRWAGFLPSFEGLSRLYEQADVNLPFPQFVAIAAVLAGLGGVAAYLTGAPLVAVPAGALSMGVLPLFWLVMRKKKRVKTFTSQMPDALELVARALRAGHGLASGLNVVADEMPAPIAHEFGRIFEEQNLGIPLEDALRGLSERVPTMDVRFFVTAVVIQRATGGDLAEVLDKIGRIIRERFQIHGQVQALTAEGRLSGVVLLAMPPSLLGFIHLTNPDYVRLLFTTPVGVKMLTFAGVMQVVGAVAIKKIITIKV